MAARKKPVFPTLPGSHAIKAWPMGCEQKEGAQVMPMKERDECSPSVRPLSINWNLAMTVGCAAITGDQRWESCSLAHFLTVWQRNEHLLWFVILSSWAFVTWPWLETSATAILRGGPGVETPVISLLSGLSVATEFGVILKLALPTHAWPWISPSFLCFLWLWLTTLEVHSQRPLILRALGIQVWKCDKVGGRRQEPRSSNFHTFLSTRGREQKGLGGSGADSNSATHQLCDHVLLPSSWC